ncbi:hypothetical protein CcrC1_gp296 [Caulobacter phage C1]|nr:hypothetical protein CcrC1_gp296 [Caulobacter phage C1]UTU08525.1 hypothetical protein CcrC2_gp297 [Caulobacter phage C2]UTU09041.1 hypothetical protein CcrJ4_gp292 [Caulobacter phage J4]UTU10158.1 hypothetical protein CcrRB23_gp296 [Caulobacter phage RB23]WGN97192.1 hypothetical protein [Bertelyvirus sp.]
MTTFQTVNREYTPGLQQGVDYGSKPIIILARSPKAALLWVAGSSFRSGIGMTSYSPAYMKVIEGRSLSPWGRYKTHEFERRQHDPAVRLSGDLILARAEKINEFFGADVAKALAASVKAKKTLLVDGGGEPFKADAKTERKQREAAALKVALANNVNRRVEPEGVACCRQCGIKLRPYLQTHYLEEGQEPATSLEELQRRHNAVQVISTKAAPWADPSKAHLIGVYETWDRESYRNGAYFCHDDCAKDYATRAVEAYAPLPVIPMEEDEE